MNPLDAGGEQIIYRACDNLLNDLFYNHAIIENGVIYLQDGDRLITLGLSDSSSTYICDIPFYLDFSLHVPKGNYCYVILDGFAYFWDTVHRQMVSVDIETKRESIVSQDCYLFLQLSPTGMIVSIIPRSVLEDFLDDEIVDSWDQIQICFASTLPGETDGLFHIENSVVLNSLDYVLVENGHIIDVLCIS